MSTRAVYVFKENKDDINGYSVFRHFDGYPSGAARWITEALYHSWDLPRYEPDEFAAAFVVANKTQHGGVRLSHGAETHSDIEYVYEVFQAPNGQLIIQAYKVDFHGFNKKREEIFYGRLKDFVGRHGDNETKKLWDDKDLSPNKLLDPKHEMEYKEYLRLKAKFE